MPRVIHFEIPAADPERAANFYKNVFNWRIEKFNGPLEYWLIMTGEGTGIDGGIFRRALAVDKNENTNAFVCTIDVPNVDEYIKKINEYKGTIQRPKQAITGVGWIAYFWDSENNLAGIMQEDKNAK